MLTAMGDVMRGLQESWITTRDGNCSARMKNRPYLYTPSGVRKTIIHPSIVKIKIQEEDYNWRTG